MALAVLIWRGPVLASGQLDGEENVVGVGAHDALDRVRLEILFLVGLQVQHDLGAAAHAGRLLLGGRDHLEAGAARRAPQPRFARPRPAARDLDPVRDHEGGIEADAELADEPRSVLGLGEPAHEGARAGAGDGAEVVDQLLAVHADAGVGDRQRAGGGVRRQADEERSGVSEQRWRRDRLVAQLVAGVRGIGDQLAQEDVALGVNGVHHQPQQLGNLGLERVRLGGALGIAAHGACSYRRTEINKADIAAHAPCASPAATPDARIRPAG